MKRLMTALVLIPLVAWSILAAPDWAFQLILAVVGGLAYYEFDNIVAASGGLRAGWMGIGCGVAILQFPNAFMTVMIVCLLAMAQALRVRDMNEWLPAASRFVLGVVYIFGAWRCAVMLRAVNPNWLMFAMLLSWAGDTFALYIGKPLGKHKLAPVVSPGKSWEGAAGSVAGAMLVGGLYAHWLIPGAPLYQILLLAIAGNIAGQIGDLCESAFKRGAGVKDSGTLLPGHGGWLDRIDSSLFSVPVVYALLTLFLR